MKYRGQLCFSAGLLVFFAAACSHSAGGPPALRIVSTLPSAGAVSVAPDGPVVVLLNRALDPLSTFDALRLQRDSRPVPGRTQYDAAALTLQFIAADGLAAGATYAVRLADTVRTIDGGAFALGFSFTFTTRAPSAPAWTDAAEVPGTFDAKRFVAHGDRDGVLCVFVQADGLSDLLFWTRWTEAAGWQPPAPVPMPALSPPGLLLLDGADLGRSVLLAATAVGLRCVQFDPLSGWAQDQDASQLPVSLSFRVGGDGTAYAAWIAAEGPTGAPLHLYITTRPWNGDWQPPLAVQQYGSSDAPVLENLDALSGGRLACLVGRPSAASGTIFESVDFDPATALTTVQVVGDRAFGELSAAIVGAAGQRVAVFADVTPASQLLLASYFTPGAGWSTAAPLGITRETSGSFVRSYMHADGTAFAVQWQQSLFDLFYGRGQLVAVVRSPGTGWAPPELLGDTDPFTIPLDGTVDDSGLQVVSSRGSGVPGAVQIQQWLMAERAWSPLLSLALGDGPPAQLQVVRSGAAAHAVWLTHTAGGQLLAAHRR
ncbi:MAG TPA: Ig-like domain-containing protein [Planctomycetota bacterium]|nr:Ig-like domain-containing protein [Planctomycetota bacterium]